MMKKGNFSITFLTFFLQENHFFSFIIIRWYPIYIKRNRILKNGMEGGGIYFCWRSSNLANLLKHIMVRAKERVRVLRHKEPVVLLQGRVEERNLHHQKSRRENTRNIAFFKQEMKKNHD